MDPATNGEPNGVGDEAACGDSSEQMALTISMQQKEIDKLKEDLKSVIARLDVLESSQGSSNRLGVKSAPTASSRRRTIDPRQMRSQRSSEDQSDGASGSKRRSMNTPSSSALSRRFAPKDKLPTIKDKDEPGTYRMYLQGRPVTFRLPTGYEQPKNPEPTEAPEQKLQMNWVYGYRGKDCRNNIWLLASGEIVYFTAAVCVIQNLETKTQRHYMEHTDDVKCLTLHPNKVIVASGQVAGHERPSKVFFDEDNDMVFSKNGKGSSKAAASNPQYMPHIRIWSSETLETLKMVGAGSLDRAVACLSFSITDGGQLLCAVDEHNDHRISVWDWNKGSKGTKLSEAKASQDAVFQAEFHPQEPNQIVCCGKNQLSFWSLDGKNLSKKMALFEKHDKPKFITCLTFNQDGGVVTGDNNGSILVWSKGSNKISQSISNAHDGVIFSLCCNPDGSIISGGGKDQSIKVWDLSAKEPLSTIEIGEEYGCARTLLKLGESYVVGTTKNAIITGDDLQQPEVVVQGHYGELWGLAEAADGNQFLTCSYDHQIKLWDLTVHRCLWTIQLTESLHCLALNSSGDKLVVGSRTPNWYLYNAQNQELITSSSCGSEQIECVEFSPNGEYLALGSRDNNIYLYKLEDGEASLSGKCQGHSSYITHIDWSLDSAHLRSNSGDYELLYWEIPACKQFTEGDGIRELEFVTQNCVLSLNTVGMWPKGADGTDINGCCINHSKTLLVSADDFGKVNMYTYPSRTPEAKAHNYGGHSSHVTSVKFASDDQHLLSAGGKDSTVIQWSLC